MRATFKFQLVKLEFMVLTSGARVVASDEEGVVGISIRRVGRHFKVVNGGTKLGQTVSITLRITPASLSILVANRDNINGRAFPRVVRRGDPHGRKRCVTIGYNTVPRNAVSSRLFKRRGNSFAKTLSSHGNCFRITSNKAVFLSRMKRLPAPARTHLLHILRAKRFVHINSSGIRGAGIHVITTAGIGLARTMTRKGFHRSLFCHLDAIPVRIPPLHRHNRSVVLLFQGFTDSYTRGCQVPPVHLSRRTHRLVLSCH